MTIRRVGAALLLAVTVVVVAVAGATPASAHAILEGTDPANNGQYDESPREITLAFTESVEVNLGGVRLYDDRAARVSAGTPKHPDGKADEVVVAIPKLDDGAYVVTWRVLSADAHPVRGAFTFSVGDAAAADSTRVQNLASRLLTEQGGDTVVGVIYALARFGVFAGVALLIGSAALLVWVWPEGRTVTTAQRLVWLGWALAVVATVVGFMVQGAYAAALGLGGVFDPGVWSEVAGTRFGQVSMLRLALLLVAAALVRVLLARRDTHAEGPVPRWWPLAAGLTGIGLVLMPGLSGHASTGSQPALAIVADAVHLAAVGLWVGALPVLGFALLRTADLAELRRAVPRYSQLALGCVIAIVVSGGYQAWRQVGSLDQLTSTDFGRLLLIKLGFFVALIVAAAFSRDVVNRKFRDLDDDTEPEDADLDADDAPSDPDEIEEMDDATATRRLRRSVRIEVVLAVVILAVTALLVNAAPARDVGGGPWIGYIKTERMWFDVNIIPAQRGPNDIHVTGITPGGAPNDMLEMEVELTNNSRDIAPIELPLRRLGPGHYFSPGFQIPFSGEWTLTIRALLTETDQVTATGEVDIR